MNADFSKTEVQIDQLHWKIHNGILFNVTDTVTGSAAIVYYFKTGLSMVHLRYVVSSNAACSIALNEGVTSSANGSAKTIVNYNRNSANVALTTCFKGPTITGAGTTIDVDQAGFGTTQGQASSGSNFVDIEYDLKPSTNYTITLTPGTSTMTIFKAIFYETGVSGS